MKEVYFFVETKRKTAQCFVLFLVQKQLSSWNSNEKDLPCHKVECRLNSNEFPVIYF